MTRLHDLLTEHAGWTLVNGGTYVSVDEELARWHENCAGWTGPRVELVPVPGRPEARGLVALDGGEPGMWLGVLLPPAFAGPPETKVSSPSAANGASREEKQR